MSDRIVHPAPGPLQGIEDPVVRDHIRRLWQHHDVSIGRVGAAANRHVTKAELDEFKRLIPKSEDETLDKGYRASTLGGGESSPAAAAVASTGAPVDSTYVLADHDTRLPQHRKLTAGNNITVTDGGAGGDEVVAADVTAAFGNSIVRFSVPSGMNSSGFNSVGLPWTAGTSSGPGTPTRFGQMMRVMYGAAAAAPANTRAFAVSAQNGSGILWRGVSGYGGFYNRFVFCTEKVRAAMKWAVGIRNDVTTPLGTVNPSAFINCVMVGVDPGDSNIQLMYNDGSGTCTKVDLGVEFPALTPGEIYVFDIWCAASQASFNWRLRRFDHTTVQGTVSVDIPVATLFLAQFVYAGNGAVTTTAAQLSFMFVGCEMPYLPQALVVV